VAAAANTTGMHSAYCTWLMAAVNSLF
jgi:hypothetical protein